MNIIATQSVAFAKEIFSSLGDVLVLADTDLEHHHLKKADALIIRSKTKVDSALLDNTPISFVGTATAGIDHLDLHYLEQHHIQWRDARGTNARSVAEYVVAALLQLATTQGFNLADKTIGIIGKGHVGSELALLAKALGFSVLLNDPPLKLKTNDPDLISLDTLLENSDIISLHVPLVMSGDYPTYHFVNKPFLSQLKPGALFINTSRGEVVNENDLLAYHKKNKLSAMVLDVFANEPLIDIELLQRATIATPHIAGHSVESRIEGSLKIYRDLCQILGKTPEVTLQQLLNDNKEQRITVTKDKASLYDVVKQVYDVTIDHQALLEGLQYSPSLRGEHFKSLREHYRQRYLFQHYLVNSTHVDAKLTNTLIELGFRISE